ncbi:metallophosphoesterase family protein [Gordonia alkaliphila]|uniref:Nuclease SbcCD subunit D n=1 Tax=Gordonia alkaliphila TaxID=1053547 RepID=A0ABP8Z719_9ACTN
MTASLFDLPDFDDHPPAAAAAAPAGEPGAEREVTFLHTADWQLGMGRHFLGGQAQHTYDAARADAVVAIGALAQTVGAEFVVVCGDVFDDPKASSRVIRRTLDALGDYPVPVYLLPGNHDPLDSTSIYRSETFVRACPANVHVLDHAGVVRVRDGVSLVAAPWTSKRPESDLIADQLGRLAPADDLRIVVGHGGVDQFSPAADPATVAVGTLQAAVDTGLVDYVALGDRHSVTSIGDSGRIWYSGAPEVTDFDHVEHDSGQVLAVTLRRGQESAVSVAPHQVGQWRFTTIRRDVNGAADLAALREELTALPDKSRTVAKLALVGTLGVADAAAFDELFAEFGERLAALWIWERQHDLTVVADPSDVAGLGLSGYAAQTADELVAAAGSDDAAEAAAARSALSLLFRLAGSGVSA